MDHTNTVPGDLATGARAAHSPSKASNLGERYGEIAQKSPAIPDYLHKHYWWAYVHPNAVRVFERQWLANLILWGNYPRLRDSALSAMGLSLTGRTIQIACAYGDVTTILSKRVRDASGHLDVIDVLPTQLNNLQRKLPADMPVALHLMDSAALTIPDASYDRALIFFLLHEQPESWRKRTLAEAFRVVKPGGRIVIVDYACPNSWNPLKRLFGPILKALEPFALDLWHEEVSYWMPEPWASQPFARRAYFGGLYQEIVIQT